MFFGGFMSDRDRVVWVFEVAGFMAACFDDLLRLVSVDVCVSWSSSKEFTRVNLTAWSMYVCVLTYSVCFLTPCGGFNTLFLLMGLSHSLSLSHTFSQTLIYSTRELQEKIISHVFTQTANLHGPVCVCVFWQKGLYQSLMFSLG